MGRHGRARTKLDEVIDDDFIAGFEPVEDGPVLADPAPGHDRADGCFILFVDHIHSLAHIGGLHCDLGHQENAILLASHHAGAHELPGQQALIAIVECGAQLLRTEQGIDLAGGEIQFAFFFVFRAIRQYQRYLLHPLFIQGAAKLCQLVIGKTEAYPYGR